MRISSHLLKFFFLHCCLMMAHELRAQLPQCSDTNTVFYFHGYIGYHDLKIFNYDTKKPISATNPILNPIPLSAGGWLAVSPNITTGDSNLTFYPLGPGDRYHYFDGNTNSWVNTGHRAMGSSFACNMGVGGGYIYNVVGGTGEVYKYDGKGDDVFVVLGSTSPNLEIAYDVIADNDGNFYLLSTDVSWSPVTYRYLTCISDRYTIAGLNYSLKWSPVDYKTSGQTTLHPLIQPTTNTTFLLELSTPQCGIIRDSVSVTLNDVTVKVGFSFDYNYACTSDTITFTNTSVNNAHNRWRFGDQFTDDVAHPVHTYFQQDNYKVTLFSWNKWCGESISHYVDTRHPLAASFVMNDDTICLGDPVIFNNTSELTLLPERHQWDKGLLYRYSQCDYT